MDNNINVDMDEQIKNVNVIDLTINEETNVSKLTCSINSSSVNKCLNNVKLNNNDNTETDVNIDKMDNYMTNNNDNGKISLSTSDNENIDNYNYKKINITKNIIVTKPVTTIIYPELFDHDYCSSIKTSIIETITINSNNDDHLSDNINKILNIIENEILLNKNVVNNNEIDICLKLIRSLSKFLMKNTKNYDNKQYSNILNNLMTIESYVKTIKEQIYPFNSNNNTNQNNNKVNNIIDCLNLFINSNYKMLPKFYKNKQKLFNMNNSIVNNCHDYTICSDDCESDSLSEDHSEPMEYHMQFDSTSTSSLDEYLTRKQDTVFKELKMFGARLIKESNKMTSTKLIQKTPDIVNFLKQIKSDFNEIIGPYLSPDNKNLLTENKMTMTDDNFKYLNDTYKQNLLNSVDSDEDEVNNEEVTNKADTYSVSYENNDAENNTPLSPKSNLSNSNDQSIQKSNDSNINSIVNDNPSTEVSNLCAEKENSEVSKDYTISNHNDLISNKSLNMLLTEINIDDLKSSDEDLSQSIKNTGSTVCSNLEIEQNADKDKLSGVLDNLDNKENLSENQNVEDGDRDIDRLINLSALTAKRYENNNDNITNENRTNEDKIKKTKKDENNLLQFMKESEKMNELDESESDSDEEKISEGQFLVQTNICAKESLLKLSSSDSELSCDEELIENANDTDSSDSVVHNDSFSNIEKFFNVFVKNDKEQSLSERNTIKSDIDSVQNMSTDDAEDHEEMVNGKPKSEENELMRVDSDNEDNIIKETDNVANVDALNIQDQSNETQLINNSKSVEGNETDPDLSSNKKLMKTIFSKELFNTADEAEKKNRSNNSSEVEKQSIIDSSDSDCEILDASIIIKKKTNTEKQEIEKIKKKTNIVVKKTNDCIDVSSDTDSDIVEEEVENKGRHTRSIMSEDQLAIETKTAQKEEDVRNKLLKLKHEKLSKVIKNKKKLNNKGIVLDYDTARKEYITVHPLIVEQLKPHQIDGIKFMYDSCYGSVDDIDKFKGSGCILAHCMGLGKTLQMISLLHTLISYKQLKTQRILVICPKTTVMNWNDEFHRWLKPIPAGAQWRIHYFPDNTDTDEKIKILERWYNSAVLQRAGILLIGYEQFRSLVNYSISKTRRQNLGPVDLEKVQKKFDEYLLNPGADLIICDEGHIIKNKKSATNQAVSKIKSRRRIILTGTPIQNNLKEYYCMVNFIKPSFLGTQKEFSNLYENPIKAGQHTDSTEREIKFMKQRSFVLHRKLSKFVQRREAAVLKCFLPEKFEYVIFIPLTKEQKRLYEFFLDNHPQKKMYTGKNLIADYTTLRKIWTHPKVLEIAWKNATDLKNKKDMKRALSNHDSDAPDDLLDSQTGKMCVTNDWWRNQIAENDLESLTPSNKLIVMFEILKLCQENNEKCLIFSAFVAVLNMVEYFMKKIDNQFRNQKFIYDDATSRFSQSWECDRDYYRLDGNTPKALRHNMIKQFNNPENTRARCFLISSRAGGQGINLIGASRVILLDTSWNPSNDQQNIFRIFRLGQTKKCYIYRLVAMGTMEEKVYSRAVTKQAMSFRVVDEQQIDRHYSMSELAELYVLTTPKLVERPVPVRPIDTVLASLLHNFPDKVYKYHEHDSLLENKPEQDLSEADKAEAWASYENDILKKNTQDNLNMFPGNINPNFPPANVHPTPSFQQLASRIMPDMAFNDMMRSYENNYVLPPSLAQSNLLNSSPYGGYLSSAYRNPFFNNYFSKTNNYLHSLNQASQMPVSNMASVMQSLASYGTQGLNQNQYLPNYETPLSLQQRNQSPILQHTSSQLQTSINTLSSSINRANSLSSLSNIGNTNNSSSNNNNNNNNNNNSNNTNNNINSNNNGNSSNNININSNLTNSNVMQPKNNSDANSILNNQYLIPYKKIFPKSQTQVSTAGVSSSTPSPSSLLSTTTTNPLLTQFLNKNNETENQLRLNQNEYNKLNDNNNLIKKITPAALMESIASSVSASNAPGAITSTITSTKNNSNNNNTISSINSTKSQLPINQMLESISKLKPPVQKVIDKSVQQNTIKSTIDSILTNKSNKQNSASNIKISNYNMGIVYPQENATNVSNQLTSVITTTGTATSNLAKDPSNTTVKSSEQQKSPVTVTPMTKKYTQSYSNKLPNEESKDKSIHLSQTNYVKKVAKPIQSVKQIALTQPTTNIGKISNQNVGEVSSTNNVISNNNTNNNKTKSRINQNNKNILVKNNSLSQFVSNNLNKINSSKNVSNINNINSNVNNINKSGNKKIITSTVAGTTVTKSQISTPSAKTTTTSLSNSPPIINLVDVQSPVGKIKNPSHISVSSSNTLSPVSSSSSSIISDIIDKQRTKGLTIESLSDKTNKNLMRNQLKETQESISITSINPTQPNKRPSTSSVKDLIADVGTALVEKKRKTNSTEVVRKEIDDSIKRIHSYEGLTIIQRNAKKVQQSSDPIETVELE